MTDTDQLIELYAKNSKHSNYQILSKRLAAIIDKERLDVHTRYEQERLDYILKKIDVTGKSLVDIGGNSGFFSFEMIEAGAKHILFYEGNQAHAEFVTLAAQVLGVSEQFDAKNQYFSFTNELQNKVDVVLLLNVLHHLGDDYGNPSLTIHKAKEEMLQQLNTLAAKTTFCVVQWGFNWKGNRHIGLFDGGTKAELIHYVKQGIGSYWTIEHIGIAVKKEGTLVYEDLNEKNVERDDTLGEFLNRPIFILRSTIENHQK